MACRQQLPKETPRVVFDTTRVAERAAATLANTPVRLADGLGISLWASDSLAPDPIALSIDDDGSVYLTRTNRQKNSEFDIRGHRDWMTPSIALQSVEDRRAFLHKIFAPENSKANEWLPDLNKDSIHDWHDLAVEKDEVWKLQDRDGDGYADVSTRILSDFADEVSDVAGALLVRKEDVFVGIGPDMWRLRDTNEDGVLDSKESISHGYAVHVGFSGHGMSGVIEGPDGKIYWGIGDIGANITAKDGKQYAYPNEGVIVRSNPDGSDFEVFASGLRNTHEFVFDAYGNIITSDNDGDHPGESERLMHVVEGSDAGWRANWQYGKYTDPKNNSYKVWMDERLYVPRWEGQAAYIIPPIVNYHNGPTGMVFNPGTALGKEWMNKFFLVEFVGNPSRSHIWSFSLKPKGASFEFDEEVDVLSGILPTGIRFGPDGALYVADWINGWGTKNYGRVWRLDVTADKNNLKTEREETQRLMQLDYSEQSVEQLSELLSWSDMRVRQKAQFELAQRKGEGYEALVKAAKESKNQFARIHGIWGIGQMAAVDKQKGMVLMELLRDSDPEIVAQATRVIGDVRLAEAGELLIAGLTNENDRVRFFSAQALGRIAHKPAVDPLLKLIEANADADVYLRHAAVLALARIGDEAAVASLAGNPNRSLRIAAVLVLRRMRSEKVSQFLKDEDEYIVTEAARAIHDDLSIEAAMPALAEILTYTKSSSAPLLRRAISACQRVGGEKELDILLQFSSRTGLAPEVQAEALAALGTWPEPSVTDRVDGRYRGETHRDPAPVVARVRPQIGQFLTSKQDEVLIATARLISDLEIQGFESQLKPFMLSHKSPEVRAAMLTALYKLKSPEMQALIKKGMADPHEQVRATALGMLSALNIPAAELPATVEPVFLKGSVREQQELLRVLGEMGIDKTGGIFNDLLSRQMNNKLKPDVWLDLAEAVDATGDSVLIRKRLAATTNEELSEFSVALYGGSGRRGWWIFNNNSSAQCVRCHALNGEGGIVGPELSSIGNVLSREQLMEAMVNPSKRLAPGYGFVTLTLDDGNSITGTLMEENAKELLVKTSDAEPLRIPVSRITKRDNIPSAMPPMGNVLTKREIRDLVEFLSGQRRQEVATSEGHGTN
jgi:putative membrane-bound dehydrogenase-like protein